MLHSFKDIFKHYGGIQKKIYIFALFLGKKEKLLKQLSMRLLSNLKLAALSLLFVGGMSSCMDSEDKFSVYPNMAYVLQSGIGENARFTPAIQLYGNEPIAQAKATFDGNSWSFKKMDETGYFMEIASSYMTSSLDTIPNGYFAITATNAENEVATTQVGFSGDKKLGEVNLTEFTYTASNGNVTAKWNKVENATSYYLMYRTTNTMWLVVSQLTAEEKDNVMSATLSGLSLAKDTEYKLVIAASYKSLVKIGNPVMDVIGGIDASLEQSSVTE